ncbi:MAG TPA: GNAT family N-acetyltransferase [Azospirillum sp.]|nr:GNAT family N-acetyltransferase [Azospirillum sp.]
MRDPVTIRAARPAEAPALLDLVREVDAESPFLPREPGEPPSWLVTGRPAEDLQAFQARGNATVFVGEDGGRLVGYLGANGGRLARNRGVLTLKAGVRAAWHGRGLGTRLFAAAEDWAHAIGAHRLELTAAAPNLRAHALYRRLGYVDEGSMRDAMQVAGAWRDELILGKPLSPADAPNWAPLLLDAVPPALPGPLTIRPAGPEDADAYHAFDAAVRRETPFLLRGPEEGLAGPEHARRFLAGVRKRRAVTLAAVGADGGIAGAVSVWTGSHRRTAHDGAVALAVRRDHWECGVGTRLLAEAEAWAGGSGLHRLSAWILGHNARARRFAASRGYAEEAVCRRYARIDGRFVDHVLVAKLLG